MTSHHNNNSNSNNRTMTQEGRMVAQLRTNVDIQEEMLKAMNTYRIALNQLAQASEGVAHAIGKLAVNTITAYQQSKTFKQQHGIEEDTAHQDNKQRQLTAALQQLVKFHTMITTQHQVVASSITHDFDRPLHFNLEAYRQLATNWEKELEKETKRIQHELKNKEAEVHRQQKKNLGAAASNPRLQTLMHEVAMLHHQLDQMLRERLQAGMDADRRQHILMAHHLQKVLRANVRCYRSVYYQENNSSGQKALVANAQPLQPTLKVQTSNTNVATPLTSTEKSPLMPSTDRSLPMTPLSPVDQREQRHSKERSLDDAPYPEPNTRKSSMMLPGKNSLKQEDPSTATMPSLPSHPHRKTMQAPVGASLEDVEDMIASNFQEHPAPRLSMMSRMDQPWRKTQTPISATEAFLRDEGESGDESDQPLSILMYDFEAKAEDDLSVREGDVLRVIAVEGEWLYGVLMQAVDDKENQKFFEPVRVKDVIQVGWVPLAYTETMTVGERGETFL